MSVSHALAAAERGAVLCWLATVDPHGRPSVSPKEVFVPLDGRRLAIAHIASPRSVANIAARPQVCVGFVDVFLQKGWQLIGCAEVRRAGTPAFDAIAAPLAAKAGPAFVIRAAIVVDVEQAVPIVAPSYRLHGDAIARELVRQAGRTYLGLLRRHRAALARGGAACGAAAADRQVRP